MKAELVLSPAGLIPRSQIKEACKLLAVAPDDYENPSLVGWTIVPDTLREKEKYKDMINAGDSRGGWDLPYLGDNPPSTALKHQIESMVYDGYRRKYGNVEVSFESYKRNTSPEIRNKIISRIHQHNTQAKESGASEVEMKRSKVKKSLEKKFQFLNS